VARQEQAPFRQENAPRFAGGAFETGFGSFSAKALSGNASVFHSPPQSGSPLNENDLPRRARQV
jgi:hypothetical protein